MKKKEILYEMVANHIKEDILNGTYPLGGLIPSEPELEKQYNVSKITVRTAIEGLVTEGYLEKRSGVGTKVISNRLFNRLSKANSFSSILESKKRNLTKTILGIDFIGEEDLPESFPEHFGPQVTRIRRLYKLDGQPYIYFEHYLPFQDQSLTIEALESNSLYQLLKDHHRHVNSFEDTFEVNELSATEQSLLDTAETHILKRKRLSISTDNEFVEISFALYNTKIFPYTVEYEV